MNNTIQRDTHEWVQTLRFNRPEKKNAITSAMYGALADGLREGDADPDIAVHMLVGTQGVFTAGNDLNDFLDVARGGEFDPNVFEFMKAIIGSQKPVIAAVDGVAVGIGTTMLLHCDLVYASDRARFMTPFLNLGLVPEAASSLLAPACMGYMRAFELLCLGTPLDAADAKQAGLVNAVVPPGDLEARARDAALTLAAKPAEALLAARRFMRGDQSAILQRIDEEIEAFKHHLRSAEAAEAFEAFREKRKPDFSRARKQAEKDL